MKNLSHLILAVILATSCGKKCPASSLYKKNVVWMDSRFNWRNRIIKWMNNVEEQCSESFHETKWKTAFSCPDFSEIRCRNSSMRQEKKDLSNCTIVSCSDGRYRDNGVIEKIWRLDSEAHNKMMSLYEEVLRECTSRECDEDNETTVATQNTTLPKFVPSVRLVGGYSSYAGRVEINFHGVWGTICDNNWDINDARVVCRMLGFTNARAALRRASFGRGNGAILLDNVVCSGNEASITECTHRGWATHYCGHHQDASVICQDPDRNQTDISVRLVGGNSSHSGRVELNYHGIWGTVCDDSWDINDARVICRMLGFPNAIEAPRSARFGKGTGTILLDDVACFGGETSITECRHRGWLSHNCGHQEDASVVCQDADWNQTDISVRLVGGNSLHAGRVELNYHGIWGTVCDDYWDITDARVICRMLGFPSALDAPRSARFGRGTGSILLDDVTCSGSETSITECRHREWFSHNCGHHEDASVICQLRETDVRLAGGNSSYGRVEINLQGAWGTICDNNWDIDDARVICRMLGFMNAAAAPRRASFGRGNGSVLLNEVACLGNESSITECGHRGLGLHHCGHYQDASVICQQPNVTETDISVRLVGGNSSNAGRVEINYHGVWGTVCDSNWDMDDARVVCRMLGFANAAAAPSRASFGRGTGPILLNNVLCLGNESTISNCSHRGWGVHSCSHYQDASVICQQQNMNETDINVRLVGGNSSYGRVEINFYGVWGTVCDSNWDMSNARVVCRMLGFRDAAAAPRRASFGRGTAPILLSDVACSGNETSISECRHRGWGLNYCSHYQDASVICQQQNTSETNISVRLAGNSSTFGRVEIKLQGVWGTVCDSNWDINDARVVCRMLGFTDAAAAPRRASFGRGTRAILLSDVACTGNESSISECRHSGWGVNYCSHYQDASVICQQSNISETNTSVRLLGGDSSRGRVEINFHGVWGSVCDNYWGMADARVICRMLGFSNAIAAPRRASFGQGTGIILLNNVACSGNETSIFECAHSGWGVNYCSHYQDASVICDTLDRNGSDISVRLAGGNSSYGRVEIKRNGIWGTICDDFWGIDDASVICRMLGFSSATSAPHGARFGRGTGPILLDNVACSGRETSIVHCDHGGWEKHNCGHHEDASVVCQQ